MNITEHQGEGTLLLGLEGRLDTNTAPQLESIVKGRLEGITRLELDFAGLDYLSSAGLRVILAMIIRNVNDTIMEVFEVTGFSDILTIE